jgi:hypothetical protein
MCGPGKTCNVDKCGPPLTYACFTSGTNPEGSSCTQDEDCAVGHLCLHYDTVYACRKLCVANADCPAGFLCTETFTCGDNPATAGKYCSRPCSDTVSPAGSAVCAAGFRCHFLCDRTTHVTLPPTCDFEAGTQKSGPCSSISDCAPGYICLRGGADGGGTCTQECRTDPDCTAGKCTGLLYCDTVATTYKYCQLTP